MIIGTMTGLFFLLAAPCLGGGGEQDSQRQLGAVVAAQHPAADPAEGRRPASAAAKLPLYFETNLGQVDESVRFLARGPGYTLFLTPQEAVLALLRAPAEPPNPLTSPDSSPPNAPEPTAAVLRFQFIGARAGAGMDGLEALPARVNYLIGSDQTQWRTGAPVFGAVKYADLWPGVEVIYRGSPQQLSYEFRLAPGADPGLIRLAVQGARSVAVDADGGLVLDTGAGRLRQSRPVIYQDIAGVRRLLNGGFALLGENQIGFQIAAYDPSQPLVIDPVWDYSTYLGGQAADEGLAVAVDASGSAYVTGSTRSLNFPQQGALQTTLRGGKDVFIAKLNPEGNGLIYATYLGGSLDDEGRGIALDSTGQAYVTGMTSSTNFPQQGPLQPYGGGPSDAFLAKLSPAGNALVYATYLGGNKTDYGRGVAVDPDGNAYVTGATNSWNFPLVKALRSYRGGTADAFVSKLNAAGSALAYSTCLGGWATDEGRGIVVDDEGRAYVTGMTNSLDFPLKIALQPGYGGGTGDAFVATLEPGGAALGFATYLGGKAKDEGAGIALDQAGRIYVAGTTESANFPVLNAAQPGFGGLADAFVAALEPAGAPLLYATYLGGSQRDEATGVAVSSPGNAYVTGVTQSANLPLVKPVQGGPGGDKDAFLSALSTDGAQWGYATYLGGKAEDRALGIAVDDQGNAWLAGVTKSTNFPVVNGLQPVIGDTQDAFVTKIHYELPGVEFLSPTEGATVFAETPVDIAFQEGETPLDLDSFRLFVNGVEVTAQTLVKAAGATYTPPEPFPLEGNEAQALIADQGGMVGAATIHFGATDLKAIPGANPVTGNAPLTVRFTTDGKDLKGTIEVFRWDFDGNGTWDTYDTVARDISHTYSKSGAYTATLLVQSSTGNTATASVTITVTNSPPVATADVTPSNGAIPLTVQFVGAGSDPDGSVVLYEWDFDGDGVFDWSSPTTGNTSHTYTEVGTFQAVFRVTDNQGATGTAVAVTTTISTGPVGSPTAAGTATPSTGPAPLAVNFNGVGTDPDGGTIAFYEWDFDNDGVWDWSSSTAAATSHTYVNPGTYVAVFRVTDNTGKTGVDYLLIEVGLQVNLSVERDQTFNPYAGEGVGIRVDINAPIPAEVVIKDGVGQVVKTIPVPVSAVKPPVFPDTMEGGVNGWTHGGANDLWQLGAPVSGPGAAHSGANVWGTNLAGNYVNNMNSWLLSPSIQITEPSELHFYHYFASESYYDGGVVEVTTDGVNFTRIEPLDGYPYQGFGFGGNAYSGFLGGWSEQAFDLSPYVGQTIQIRFRFLSDYIVTSTGWYIDDVKVIPWTGGVIWDGKDNNSLLMRDGVYYAVLRYQFQGVWRSYDLTETTGGERHDFPFGDGCDQRANLDQNYPNVEPFADHFLTMPFKLCSAQEVTAFIGPLWTGLDQTRIRTIVNRQAFPAGSSTIYWDGLDDQGNVAQAPPGDSLITGFFRYDLPDNGIYLTGGRPVITALGATPNYFSPFSEKCTAAGYGEGITLSYSVSENVVAVEFRVYSVATGSLLRSAVTRNVTAGDHVLFWDGKNNQGEYVDIGDYQVGFIATDAEGNSSMLRYTLVRVDY